MTRIQIAGILSAVLPFAAIETANAAGIVSYNRWHPIKTARADSLAGPSRNGKMSRGFRFTAPNVVAGTEHSDAGLLTLAGGTLSLSGGVIKVSSGTLQLNPTTSLSGVSLGGGTLNINGSDLLFSDIIYSPTDTVSISNWSGLSAIGSGTLTLVGGAGFGYLNTNTLGGTLDLETSQTLNPLVIGSSGGIVVIGNGGTPPTPVGDASGQSSQPVPEPSAAALLAMSAAALLTRRVRNRK